MANAPSPPIAARTGLWGLGFRLESIGLRFTRTYENIKDVWMIGKWLSWPFYILGLLFLGARSKSWEADDALVNVISWVRGIIEGSTLIHLLENLWYDFRLLKTNPILWLRNKLDVLSAEYRQLREDPLGWIRARVFIAIPVLSSVVFNSGYWIYRKLSDRFPGIGSFLTNPFYKVRDWVLSSFLWARQLNISPTNTIIDWISSWYPWFRGFITYPTYTIISLIKGSNYELRMLFENPIEWVKRRLANALGVSYAAVTNLPVAIVKKLFYVILTNQEGLLNYVEQAFCDVIIKFI